jgi:GNAT superfamily N-acetyltransferase
MPVERTPVVVERDGYRITDDGAAQDLEVIHLFLSMEAYWSKGIARDLVERAIAESLCLGVFAPGGQQVGFARVVTDRSTFGYLCDVFIVREHRGRGLGRWLCETVLGHPDLQGLRRFLLATPDAHALYAALGFLPVSKPDRFMERYVSAHDLYQRSHGDN